jgi:hypothetical protein
MNGKTMKGMSRTLLVYDIMCQWYRNFLKRVQESPYLRVPPGMKIYRGIGDFHVKGHIHECFPRYGLVFVEGAGVIDGEVVETLWSVMNKVSPSTRSATLAHRTEVLDDHMNNSNWKKLIAMGMSLYFTVGIISIRKTIPFTRFPVPTLIKKHARAEKLFEVNKEGFLAITATANPADILVWEAAAKTAQAERYTRVEAMDYFDVKTHAGTRSGPHSIRFTYKK